MKQLLQNLRDGKAVVADVPAPGIRKGMALVHTAVSLVSVGTERSVVEFAEKGLVGKARSRPDLVRQMLDKARREGLLTTLEAVFNRLDQPMALGYSSAGVIVEVGEGLHGFHVGDQVACAGAGFASHSEFTLVPQNLLSLLPAEVDFESAAFATLGAIAMHGFRLAQVQLGERVAIIGLGLLGLLTADIAQAAGCEVCGFDLDPRRVDLLKSMGMSAALRESAESMGASFTHGGGFDAVLITADSRSDDPVILAGALARDRARVIAVGAVGLNIPRKIYYEKELSFFVSRSYGPGRYDAEYEERGRDYPIGYVRWTEGRNLQSFIDLLAGRKLDVHNLITHSFSIAQADQAYELISHNKNHESILGVLLTYPGDTLPGRRIDNPLVPSASKPASGQLALGVLGAGNYASAIFLPVIKKAGGINLAGVVSASGLSARHAAQRFGFGFSGSDEKDILDNPEINVVTILTRHNQHARQALAALRLGKHVYCEKPLAIHAEELAEIAAFLRSGEHPVLMVGFNRRFAPMAIQLKDFLGQRSEPLVANYRVNAGYLPLNHWLHALEIGGGRIIGEGCHFVDFLTFLVGTPPISVSAQALPDNGRYQQDNVLLTLTFGDGSIGTLQYLANGDKSFAKERVEVFCGGQAAALDDFRTLELVKNGNRKVSRAPLRQDKGHRRAWEAFLATLRQGGEPPIPYTHLLGVTQATFMAAAALTEGRPEPVAVEIP